LRSIGQSALIPGNCLELYLLIATSLSKSDSRKSFASSPFIKIMAIVGYLISDIGNLSLHVGLGVENLLSTLKIVLVWCLASPLSPPMRLNPEIEGIFLKVLYYALLLYMFKAPILYIN
jgi:hypothetical protein